MSTARAAAEGEEGDGDRVVELLGVEVVIEEDFVAFPWRAGVARAPVAFLLSYALVALLSAVAGGGTALDALLVLVGVAGLGSLVVRLRRVGADATRAHLVGSVAALLGLVVLLAFAGGDGSIPFDDRLAILGIVTFNTHNIHAATALVPGAFAPVADPVLATPVVGRLLGGLFAVGQSHAAPVAHLLDVAGGATGTAGHVNLLEQQETTIPTLVYYLVPVAVLGATGYEFATAEWDDAATDSPVEMVRFGLAVAVGYVATLLVGTVVLTYEGASPLAPDTVFTVMPDRYLTVVFGFVYPAVLVSLGAAVVYLRRELGTDGDTAATPEEDA